MPRSQPLPYVPERWLLPPAPRERDLRARWRELSFDRRHALATAVGRSDADALDPTLTAAIADRDLRAVVAGLIDARLATGWRLHVTAVFVGWLVLMTIWGFGRSSMPTSAATFLVVGLVAGSATALSLLRGARHRLARLHRVRAELPGSSARQ